MYLDPHRITAQKGLFPLGGLPLSNERAFEVYKIILHYVAVSTLTNEMGTMKG